MPVVVRRFQRRDRDQLTELINLHVAAVIPGVVLSVNTVLSQLEREPGESIVDPWVAERCCLVAEFEHRIVAAALLHRFRTDDDVSDGYRGAGDVRWLVCHPDLIAAGHALLAGATEQMRRWGVTAVGVDCALPAPGCYGIADTMPHLRALLSEAGFGEPTRRELVLAASCADLVSADIDAASTIRTVGTLGTRFTLLADEDVRGYIEVCPPSTELARSYLTAPWADVGNLILTDGVDPAGVIPALLSVAARWLLLGGVTRLIDYRAADVDPPEYLTALHRAGFHTLVSNERGFRRLL